MSTLAHEITQRPDFAMVTVKLEADQQVFAEPAAMAAMDANIHMKAGFKGGFKATLGRAFGGESMIVNTFTAKEGPGEVVFAAGTPGDAVHYPLNGSTLYLQRGAYMANSDGVEISGKWQGAKGFFSGEGLVLLKASGTGDVFFNSFGAILEVDVAEAGYIVDTGYIVAFEDTLDYKIRMVPGMSTGGKLKSFLFGGEGLVCEFSGHGRVWIQTRAAGPFLNWTHPFRPTRNNN
ncbi:MAG: TIGR00266 family protein [Planctomycetota bacterium]